MAESINNKNLTEFGKGLNTDNSPILQPKGTQRFALNAVNETELGDFLFPSNEESNEVSINFPTGYTPIGKKYIGEGKTIIFLVKNDESSSEIGMFDDKGFYETHVNDSTSINKLNFKLNKPIDSTYRLRRGCERTIYFTDDNSEPRYYNLDKPYLFKINNVFDSKKFSLTRQYAKNSNF